LGSISANGAEQKLGGKAEAMPHKYSTMRCLIHDFAGHPFQIQLSRELARRGHYVTHVYPIGLDGPKGRLEYSQSDSARLEIRGVPLTGGFRKYSPLRRLAAHRRYARAIKKIVASGTFDVVMSGNTPIDVQAELLLHCRRHRVGFVHWVQDVYCRALEFFLRRRVGWLAGPLSFPFFALEQWVASRADAAIVIAPAFAGTLTDWGVPRERVWVIENWAPLDEIQLLPRANDWSAAHGLDGKTVFLYSGTLGMKHRPDLIYRLAQSLNDSCRFVVISEGIGRDYLQSKPALETLQLLDFQPYDRLSLALASADVLVTTLESDAAQFAVPSKVLSYLCAGRPLLLAAPRVNLAASVVERSASGIVVDPDCVAECVSGAHRLATDARLRTSLGENARRYAEREFDISAIAARFEDILAKAYLSAVFAAPNPQPAVVEPPVKTSTWN
jgi:colanic acid biosynthesis glycosyl transferase WcaI